MNAKNTMMFWSAAPLMVLFCWAWINFSEAEDKAYWKDYDSKWAAGGRPEETTVLQGTVDGTQSQDANYGNAALAGAGAGAATKVLGGKDNEAWISALLTGILVASTEKAESGCHIWVAVDGRHEEFHPEDWVCAKYKTGDKIAVTRKVKYTMLALPGKHDPRTEMSRDYVPAFQ